MNHPVLYYALIYIMHNGQHRLYRVSQRYTHFLWNKWWHGGSDDMTSPMIKSLLQMAQHVWSSSSSLLLPPRNINCGIDFASLLLSTSHQLFLVTSSFRPSNSRINSWIMYENAVMSSRLVMFWWSLLNVCEWYLIELSSWLAFRFCGRYLSDISKGVTDANENPDK